jgi:CubicO group peptidase (beta-lactamase class C family)
VLSVLVGLVVLGLDPVAVRTEQFVAGRKNCGVVVGVWRDGRTRVLGRGTVFLPGGERRPDGSTIFEIGSITKTLTGVLLAEAVQRGEVKLADLAAKHLPADLAPPSADPKTPVTLEHLATHRSGLPVQPAGVGLTSRNPRNPYADFDRLQLARILKELEPSKKPGESFRYSNLGVGLLGHALVRAARADSFDALLKERVCKPLGLRDTAEALTGEQRARFARAHTAEGKPTAQWDFATLEAGRGVHSTATDMLTYAAAALGALKTPLLPAFREAMSPRSDVAKRVRVGLCWMITTPEEGPVRVWHNGSTFGHRGMLILVPDQRVAVVVLCSAATLDVDQLGLDLVELVCRK